MILFLIMIECVFFCLLLILLWMLKKKMLNLIFVCIFGEVLVNKLGVLVMEFSSG